MQHVLRFFCCTLFAFMLIFMSEILLDTVHGLYIFSFVSFFMIFSFVLFDELYTVITVFVGCGCRITLSTRYSIDVNDTIIFLINILMP